MCLVSTRQKVIACQKKVSLQWASMVSFCDSRKRSTPCLASQQVAGPQLSPVHLFTHQYHRWSMKSHWSCLIFCLAPNFHHGPQLPRRTIYKSRWNDSLPLCSSKNVSCIDSHLNHHKPDLSWPELARLRRTLEIDRRHLSIAHHHSWFAPSEIKT